MTSIYSIKEMIQKSINREGLSHDLYLEWSEKVVDSEARELLRSLAKDEKMHQAILQKMLRDGKVVDLVEKNIGTMIAPVARPPAVGELTQESTAKEFISFSIHHEELAIQYYSRYMDIFRETELFPFFETMRGEEQRHKIKLEKIFLKKYAGRKV